MTDQVARSWYCGGGVDFRVLKFNDENFIVVDQYVAAPDRTFLALVRTEAMVKFLDALRAGENTLGFSIIWVEMNFDTLLPVSPEEMKMLDREVLRRGVLSMEYASTQVRN